MVLHDATHPHVLNGGRATSDRSDHIRVLHILNCLEARANPYRRSPVATPPATNAPTIAPDPARPVVLNAEFSSSSSSPSSLFDLVARKMDGSAAATASSEDAASNLVMAALRSLNVTEVKAV